jgi:hypothetical protein
MGVRGKPEGEPCGSGAGCPLGFPPLRAARPVRAATHRRAARWPPCRWPVPRWWAARLCGGFGLCRWQVSAWAVSCLCHQVLCAA